ncbi:hypothetical protein SAMN02745673_01685 [Marinactinospora thermotolerans DSM 45154]|uniref:Uncharacterized protein n=1 Tax=Marinactinospora thermotolerans DSM 45154 TaxID=1122192 RepID=A0A1T4P9B1_9ACTN|nr:hypothetical protein SAMN02745673_01685 [Marinactinospora thermotolerans DSM 45154]
MNPFRAGPTGRIPSPARPFVTRPTTTKSPVDPRGRNPHRSTAAKSRARSAGSTPAQCVVEGCRGRRPRHREAVRAWAVRPAPLGRHRRGRTPVFSRGRGAVDGRPEALVPGRRAHQVDGGRLGTVASGPHRRARQRRRARSGRGRRCPAAHARQAGFGGDALPRHGTPPGARPVHAGAHGIGNARSRTGRSKTTRGRLAHRAAPLLPVPSATARRPGSHRRRRRHRDRPHKTWPAASAPSRPGRQAWTPGGSPAPSHAAHSRPSRPVPVRLHWGGGGAAAAA